MKILEKSVLYVLDNRLNNNVKEHSYMILFPNGTEIRLKEKTIERLKRNWPNMVKYCYELSENSTYKRDTKNYSTVLELKFHSTFAF